LPYDGARRSQQPLGAAYVRRYRGSSSIDGPGPRWTWAPRLPFSFRSLVLLLVVGIIAGSLYAGYDYRKARAARADTYLIEVDAHIAASTAARGVDQATIELDRAGEALATAVTLGADPNSVELRRQAMEEARDQALNILHFDELERIGSIPPEIAEKVTDLLVDGDRLYLVAGAIYLADAEHRQLTEILSPGMEIHGHIVGDRIDANLDEDVLVVFDGSAILRRFPNGGWTAIPLEHGLTPKYPSDAFSGAYYLLNSGSGEIVKLSGQDAFDSANWIDRAETKRPVGAIDIVIDGNIYLLYADGSIVSYYLGKENGSLVPAVQPKLTHAIAMTSDAGGNYLFIAEADGTAGRVVGIDKRGGPSIQLRIPHDWQDGWVAGADEEMARMRVFAVDERNGSVYFVGERGLWRASVPAEVDLIGAEE
jgi:hypothetical protein